MSSNTQNRPMPPLVRVAYWFSQNADVPRWLFYPLLVNSWLMTLALLLEIFGD